MHGEMLHGKMERPSGPGKEEESAKRHGTLDPRPRPRPDQDDDAPGQQKKTTPINRNLWNAEVMSAVKEEKREAQTASQNVFRPFARPATTPRLAHNRI